MRWRVRLVAVVMLAPLATGAFLVASAGPAAAGCGRAVVASDFNGDGFADVAGGAPDYDDARGRVTVAYGSAAGAATTAGPSVQDFRESQFSAITPAVSTFFGAVVAAGNFNGDCYADLAVAVPGESVPADVVGPVAGAVRPDTDVTGNGGAIAVLYGSASGLTVGNVIFVQQVDGDSAFNATSGEMSLAAGDFDGDGHTDLAVGLVLSDNLTGEVLTLKGSSAGLTTSGSKVWTQDSANVPGTAEVGDQFGAALAAGDFNGDGRVDLAIGSPGEDIPGAGEAGSVTILPGSATGPTGTGSTLWTEDTTGVPGVAEDDDYWGSALAAGDLTGDGRADLIVGAPNESVDGVDEAGAVTILHGAASGLLTTNGAQLIDENTANVPGTAERGDGFGASLAVGNFNGDGYGDLAIGDPGEGVDGVTSAGTVTVLSGTSGGVSTASATLWDQNTTGILGSTDKDDDFGTDLTAIAVHGGTRADLVIGDSGETIGTQTDCGAIAVIPGSPTGLTATGNQLLEPTQLTGGSITYEYFGDTVG